jgi:hypothetical protein
LWWQVINTHIFLMCQYLLWGYQLLLYQVRVFSKAGDIDTTQMSSLRSIQVDLHIFLKKNIHGVLIDFISLETIELTLLSRIYYASKPSR